MIYTFKDIFNQELINKSDVIVILGQYAIFNNVVIDAERELSKGDMLSELGSKAEGLMSEFNSVYNGDSVSQSLDFKSFIELYNTPSISGRWFCNIDYDELNTKEKERLDRYIKKPSKTSLLVVSVTNWKEHSKFVRLNALQNSNTCNAIKLGFPSNVELKIIVKNEFSKLGYKVADKAIELFIMRMSASYDEYKEVINDIVLKTPEDTDVISYELMRTALEGIENFVFDDFVIQLTKPIMNNKIYTTRKIYKMLNALVPEFGFCKLVSKLRYKVNDLVWLRYHINNGDIPVTVRYDINKVKDRLGKDNRLNKLSDSSFRRNARIANLTTLKDWLFIKMILSNVKQSYNEEQCEKALLAVIHRNILPTDRLMNSMGVKNTLSEALVFINATPFKSEFVGFQNDMSYTDYMNIDIEKWQADEKIRLAIEEKKEALKEKAEIERSLKSERARQARNREALNKGGLDLR